MMRQVLVILLFIRLYGTVVIAQSTVQPRSALGEIARFRSPDAAVRSEAIQNLQYMQAEAVDALVTASADSNVDVRTCAIITLGKIAPAGKQAIPALTKTLSDSVAELRWCAAIALGRFGTAAAGSLSALLPLLNDTDADVRWAAYTAIQAIDANSLTVRPGYSNIIKTIEAEVPQLQKELHVPGVSICLIKDFSISWVKTYGVADGKSQVPVSSYTMFEACSMSKPVLAYIALLLVDRGMLELDKPLYQYYEEQFAEPVPGYGKLITARMILAHTSGMPNWRKVGDEIGGPIPIYYKPGTRFSYSGEGIFYLQRVIEHITGKPFDKLAKELLFNELELTGSSFIWLPELDSMIATGHDDSGKCLKRGSYRRANAAYTLYTTPVEYAKFILSIMNFTEHRSYSLSDTAVNEMIQHQSRAETRSVMDRPGRSLGLYAYRGLGWAIDSTITGDILYHGGSNQTGFRCYAQFRLHEGTGIVIMTNSVNGSELWTRIIRKIGDF